MFPVFEAKLSTDKWFLVELVDVTDGYSPETGKVFGDVTANYAYEADTSLTSYTVTTDEWREAGGGAYWVKIGESEFITPGKYTVTIDVSGCRVFRFAIEARTYTIEDMFSGTNTVTLKMQQIDINNAYGTALRARSTGSNGHGFEMLGNGSGMDIKAGEIGDPSDLGDGASLADNFITISSKSDDVAADVIVIDSMLNTVYGYVGVPTDLGDGATLADNFVTVSGKVDNAIADIGDVDVVLNSAYGRIGTPIDLGDGATLADNFTSIAGKTPGAASFDRTTDAMEALADAEADNLSVTALKDLLFKRNVTSRHANEKPQTIEAGDGATLITITTTEDVNGNIETENYA